MRDILRGDDQQINAVLEVIAATAPDILVLQNFDYDLQNTALAAFNDALGQLSAPYPHLFALRPNTGLRTEVDMDGNGRIAEPRDAQGYGQFSGQGGMAILSLYPIITDEVQDFSDLLWRDLPSAVLPETTNGAPFPSVEAQEIQRLSTTAHWVVPFEIEGKQRIHVLTFHASPPVFDGPEDRNGRRNHDEIVFWQRYLDGHFGPAPTDRFVIAGNANNDPLAGEGLKPAINGLLGDKRLQDPAPRSDGSMAASGDPFDTTDWEEPEPGNLRVDYVLPSVDWSVVNSGVYWPEGDAGMVAARASSHRLVWVDLAH